MLWRPGARLKMAPLIVLFLVIGLLGTSSDTNETLQKQVKRSIDDLNTDQTLQSNIIQRIPLASSNGYLSNMVVELETWQLETKTDVKIFRVGPEVIVRRYYYPGLAFAIRMQTPATTSATTTVSVTPASPISRTFQPETFSTTSINTVPSEGTTMAKTGTTPADHLPASEPTNASTVSAATTAENSHTNTSAGIATIPMSEGITKKPTPHSATTPESKGTTKKPTPHSAITPESEGTTKKPTPHSATTPESKGTTKKPTPHSATTPESKGTTKKTPPSSATTPNSKVTTKKVTHGSATTLQREGTTKKIPSNSASTAKTAPQGSDTTLKTKSTTKKSPDSTNAAKTEKPQQPTTKHSTKTTTTKRPTTTTTTKRQTTTTTTKRPATKTTSKRPTTAAPIHTVVPVVVQTQAPAVRIVYLQFTLIMDFQDPYNDPLSALFLALALWIEEQLDRIFVKQFPNFKSSKVTKLQKGSVIVFATLDFDNSTPNNVNISTTLYDNWNSSTAIKAGSVFVTTPSTTGAPNTVAHTVMVLLLASVFLVLRNLHVI